VRSVLTDQCFLNRTYRAHCAEHRSFASTWPARATRFKTGLTYHKSKAVPLHAMKVLGGEEIYSTYSFTTTLDGGEWSASRPGRALAPGQGPPVPIVQEAGWTPEPVWPPRIEEKSFAPAGDRTPIARSSSPRSDTILTELPRLLLTYYTLLLFSYFLIT
jgi:hypothetical protein